MVRGEPALSESSLADEFTQDRLDDRRPNAELGGHLSSRERTMHASESGEEESHGVFGGREECLRNAQGQSATEGVADDAGILDGDHVFMTTDAHEDGAAIRHEAIDVFLSNSPFGGVGRANRPQDSQ